MAHRGPTHNGSNTYVFADEMPIELWVAPVVCVIRERTRSTCSPGTFLCGRSESQEVAGRSSGTAAFLPTEWLTFL